MVDGTGDPDPTDGGGTGDVVGRLTAVGGAAGAAASFLVIALLVSLPVGRLAAAMVAVVMGLIAVGLWMRVPAVLGLGIVVGALTVFLATGALLAAGDDVYEQVPGALEAVVPALALGLGAALLVGSIATIGSGGRVGKVAATVLVALGLVVGAVGAWELLVPRDPDRLYPAAEVGCGSAFRPSSSPGRSSSCWETLDPARQDGRRLLALGVTLGLAGLGAVQSQFARGRPVTALGSGALALGVAWWTSAMPLQSVACVPANRSITGPACERLGHGLTGVSWSFAVVGLLLVAAGLAGVRAVGRGGGVRAAQVSA